MSPRKSSRRFQRTGSSNDADGVGALKVGVRVPITPPFDRMRSFVERVTSAGVESLWWADHLMSVMSPGLWPELPESKRPTVQQLNTYLDPFTCMAAVADAAGGAFLGTCVTDAIRRMPATLAQTALSIDHLAPGRVILGLGAGEAVNYRPFGTDVRSPARHFRTAAKRIRTYFDEAGPWEDGGVMGLRPPDGSPGPQLWLAAHGPRGLDATGTYADGWLPMLLTPDEWQHGRRTILAKAADCGRRGDEITMAISMEVVTRDDHESAEELLRHPAVKQQCLFLRAERFEALGFEHPLGGPGFNTIMPTLMGDQLAAAANAVPFEVAHDAIPHGTPEEIAETIHAYEGLDHIRLSDLGGLVSPGGGLKRLLRVVEILTR